jgi:hypothetical protein
MVADERRDKIMSWDRDWNAFNKEIIDQFRANGGQVLAGDIL